MARLYGGGIEQTHPAGCAGSLMPHITVSYRRTDSDAITGRIFDRLALHYGKQSVFRDIDNIPPGIDFRQFINDALQETDVLLVVIGPRWLGLRGGQARIGDESDPVRIEIETAIGRSIPIIPLLIGNTRMPNTGQLPGTLKAFAFLNAVRIDPGQDFDHHTDRLIRAMDRIVGRDIRLSRPADEPALERKPMLALTEPSAARAEPEGVPHPHAVGLSGGKAGRLSEVWRNITLAFADKKLEAAFIDFYRSNTYWQGQLAGAIGVAMGLVSSFLDLMDPDTSRLTPAHHVLDLLPLLPLALSFTAPARRFWQSFFALSALFGAVLIVAALHFAQTTSWYHPGFVVTAYLMYAAAGTLLPLTVANFLWLGPGLLLLALVSLLTAPMSPVLAAIQFSLLTISVVIVISVAYARETTMRQLFVATRERVP
jgi:TIR domain